MARTAAGVLTASGTDTVGPFRLWTIPLPARADAFLPARAMASSMAISCNPFTRTVSRPSASFSLPPLSAASVRSTASRFSFALTETPPVPMAPILRVAASSSPTGRFARLGVVRRVPLAMFPRFDGGSRASPAPGARPPVRPGGRNGRK